jgi:hypothetical protein
MAKTVRDNLPPQVVDALARRAAFICSNPDCRAFTIAPSLEDPAKYIYTGIASHITAAAPGGPRYDTALTPEQRRSIDNAIFLCGTCSIMIDKNNGIDFLAEQLRRWKEEHNEWVRRNLNKRANTQTTTIMVGPNNVVEGSVIVNYNQMGGQIAHSITNIGPQPRTIAEAAVADLVARLNDHPKESVDLTTNNDPESASLKEQIKAALIRSGWTIKSDVTDLVSSREPGVTLHVRDEDKMKQQFLAILNWFRDITLLNTGQSYHSGIDGMRIDIGSNPQLYYRP